MITEVQVCLDFSCCGCGDAIAVTLQCTGRGLAAGPRTVAAVKVPCPCCGDINKVCFRPDGEVVSVQLVRCLETMLVPSGN